MARSIAALVTLAWLPLACNGPQAQRRAPTPPPAVGAVRDGLGADIDRQTTRNSVFANWDALPLEPGQPLVVYEWSIGYAPGAVDVQPWQDVGGQTSAGNVDVNLKPDARVFVNVRARSVEGLPGPVASSNGFVVAEAPPPPAIPTPAEKPPAAPPSRPEGNGPDTTGTKATAPAPTPSPGTDAVKPAETPPAPKATPPVEPTPPTGGDPTTGVADGRATVQQHGITWTFDHPVRAGQFANGDWWVLGPVNIVAIEPASTANGGRTQNGSMLDPDPKDQLQGYDSAMFGNAETSRYEAARNVALGISRTAPLLLRPGSSLVSTVSHATAGSLPQLETAAVLTCLAQAPAADAFRPPYCGKDKVARFRAGDLDLSRLGHLAAAGAPPDIDHVAAQFERVWLDHVAGPLGRYQHPRANMPTYGRELADLVGTAALLLQLDLPDERKRPLLLGMVQLGIDVMGIVQNGGRFPADGGTGCGRKFPLLFAGAVLGSNEMLALAKTHWEAFSEDAQTFYVAATGDSYNGGHGGYGPEDKGLAEWGNNHLENPATDTKVWTGDDYRRCCTANAWHGFVLAARIMGLQKAWGHDALFDYVDRYMQVEAAGTWQRAWSPWPEKMWDAWRAKY